MKTICPRCGKALEYTPENPHRPFCSKRCKEADLYGWLVDPTEEDEISEDGMDMDGRRKRRLH